MWDWYERKIWMYPNLQKEILNQFLEATKSELVDNLSDIKKMSKSFEEITSNKIFRSLSISLYL